MREYFLIALSLAFNKQFGVYAQSQPQRSSLDVQVQRLPSSEEGTFYDQSGTPQRSFIYDQRPSYNQDSTYPYDHAENDKREGNNINNFNSQENVRNQTERESSYYSNQEQLPQSGSSINDRSTLNVSPYPNGQRTVLNEQQRPVVVEQTLSIIKPDAVRNRHIGDIISRFEQSGLRIVAIKMLTLDKDQAGRFYHIHRNRPFYRDLVDFMSSGPVVIMVLEGDQAIAKNRQLMGATDPQKADKGTIRADYAKSVSQNAVHGSDSPEAAREEILFFFQPHELIRP